MRRATLAPILILAMTVAAGCAGGSAATPTAGLTASPPPASEPAATGTPAATESPAASEPAASPSAAASAGAATVQLAETDLGTILVDGAGMTLYLFTPDEQGEPTCYDDCAAAWPPLEVEGDPTVGEGLDAAAFDTVERTDGSTQLTFNGWPLYYFANDAAPGETNGQGLNEVWFVLDAEGEPIE
jgi:predicted lipoprotein with Yx(FWY)xxD motif